MLTPEVLRTDLGTAKILAIFRTEKNRMIVGGTVAEGKIPDNAQFEIKRGARIVGKGQMEDLQQNKIKANAVLRGSEFGMSVNTSDKIETVDILAMFEET